MPIYEYQCKKCGHRFEKMQRISDAPVRKCPECGGEVGQLLSAPAVQFKGTGWYVTDYARKGSSPAKGESKSESKPETKSESKPAEAKKDKPKGSSK